ncbi:MAG TPA: hypothetical protein ACYCDB_00560 [Candidatus Azoamicus sp.]
MQNKELELLELKYLELMNLELELTFPKTNNIIELNKKYSNLKKDLIDYISYKKIVKEIEDLILIVKTESDKELKVLIDNEINTLKKKKKI